MPVAKTRVTHSGSTQVRFAGSGRIVGDSYNWPTLLESWSVASRKLVSAQEQNLSARYFRRFTHYFGNNSPLELLIGEAGYSFSN
jgi:hypothetical protein